MSFDDITFAGEAASGEEAIRICAQTHPDVVVMDLVMPGLSGAETTTAIRRADPRTQVLALTSFTDHSLLEDALRAGVVGCVMKTVTGEELAEAIRAACAGRPTLGPEAAQALIDVATDSSEPRKILTPREREVLVLIVDGLSNTEIAERLVVSVSTVKTHVSSILTKLGVTTRTAAAMRAVRDDLI